MKKAALYIRVSTEEQARHGYSLAEQRHDLERYAAAHHYAVVGVYADEGNTARKALTRRKELQRLLDDVRAGLIDVILLKCLDRWFRNIADYYKVQEILDAYNVEWECTQEDYNTTTTNGRLMLNLKLSIAQNESDQTSDRIKYVNEGLKRRRLELNGRFPFGYKKENQKLVIDESQRPIIEYIFAQQLAGASTHSIAAGVYERFHVALTAKRVWRILRNPTFKGERHGIEDYCPAIISKEIFDRTQELLSYNSQPKRKGYIYLFTGKIICPSCGSILVGHATTSYKHGKKRRYLTYFCGKRYITGRPLAVADCQYSSAISESVIEKFLLKNIQQLLHTYSVEYLAGQTQQRDSRAKAKSLKDKLTRLKELYINELIDMDTYKADYAYLQKELAEAEAASIQTKRIPPLVNQILANNEFVDNYMALTKDRQRELWQSLIKRIEIGQHPRKPGTTHKDFRITFY